MKIFSQLRRWATHACCTCACMPMAAILLKWDATPVSDLKGYKIYYGTNPQQYTQTLDAGNATQFLINGLRDNTPYYFAVTAYDTSGNESVYSNELVVQIDAQNPTPVVIPLNSYNFPNPFRPAQQATQLRYYLPAAGPVKIAVYNLGNRLVRTLLTGAVKSAGEHIEDAWDGRDDQGELVANGVYLCKIQTPQFTHMIKIAVSN